MPGLAHMTEHAVFLGSEKYPANNAYKQFLSKHGGGSNGGTSMVASHFVIALGAFSVIRSYYNRNTHRISSS